MFYHLFYIISIHALRVEGDDYTLQACFVERISIHALRVEGDFIYFLAYLDVIISIHALRVEGDFTISSSSSATLNFYPRPPGGGRQQKQTKFSSVFAQKGEEFASLRRGKRKFAGGVLKRTNFGF